MEQLGITHGIVAAVSGLIGASLPVVLKFLLDRQKASSEIVLKEHQVLSAEYKEIIDRLQVQVIETQKVLVQMQNENINCRAENEQLRGEVRLIRTRLAQLNRLHENEALVVIDEDGKILQWSREAMKMFQYITSDALGKSFYELLLPDKNRELARSNFSRIREFDTAPRSDKPLLITVMDRLGATFTVEMFMTGWKNVDKKWVIGLSISRYITSSVDTFLTLDGE